jgi:hypothetical protein
VCWILWLWSLLTMRLWWSPSSVDEATRKSLFSCSLTSLRNALLLSIAWDWGVLGGSYKISCCTYQTRYWVELVILNIGILIECNVVRRICGRKLVRSLAMMCQRLSVDRWLLKLWTLSLRRVLLSHWFKILPWSLWCLHFISLYRSKICTTTPSFGTYRHKNLVCRA